MGAQVVNFRPSGDQAWAQQAACAEEGVAPMFPHEQDTAGVEHAKSICGRCPVKDSCLTEALDRGEGFGIWGGLTAEERRTLKRQAARKAAGIRAPVKPRGSIISRPAIG